MFRVVLSIIVYVGFLTGLAVAADKTQPTAKIDEQRLLGHWLRPDGGYVLELKEISRDGTLKAAYFNPRPINVAKAALSRKDGWLTIFIELRDVNYPEGSMPIP